MTGAIVISAKTVIAKSDPADRHRAVKKAAETRAEQKKAA